jgi:ketosteroid isomerase-like protein
MAHPNEDLLRRGYQAFSTGDMDTVLSLMADDIAWHLGPGGGLPRRLSRPPGGPGHVRQAHASLWRHVPRGSA